MIEQAAGLTGQEQKLKNNLEVMFRAYAPNSTQPLLLSERSDTTVATIVEKVRQHFGFEGSYVLQDDDDRVLDGSDSIKRAGVKCGDSLWLTRKGGGVAAPALLTIHEELGALAFFAAKRGVAYEIGDDSRLARLTLTRKTDVSIFHLAMDFNDYPEFPPKLYFTDASFTRMGHKPDFPAGGSSPFGSSIFHSAGVICAPFNRLAYAEHSGPHGDWQLRNWRSMGAPDQVKAESLAEILSVILRDLQHSSGRMA